MADHIPVAMQLGAEMGDRPSDPDREPDRVYADSGRVVLAPLLVETVAADPVFEPLIAKLAITGKIIEGGWIVWEHENAITPDDGIPHIYVTDLTSTDLSPRIEAGATHTLTIVEASAGGVKLAFPRTPQRVRITPDKIDPATGVVNLAKLTTAAPPAIVQVVEGPPGPEGPQGIPGSLTPEATSASEAAVQAATEAGTARDAAQGFRDQAETIRAQIPTFGQTLGTTDLNSVTQAGWYQQTSASSATAARNYPAGAAGAPGVLEVVPMSTWLMQRYTATGNAPGLRGQYVRRYASGAWSAWAFLPAQRIDQTAGRAIYTWDDLNGREQLIYGDTGWRDISASLINGWGDQLLIGRVNSTVFARIRLDATGATNSTVLSPGPGTGFRPGANIALGARPASGSGVSWGQITTASGAIFVPPGVALSDTPVEMSWRTTDPWPTTLPGTAVGTIPNL